MGVFSTEYLEIKLSSKNRTHGVNVTERSCKFKLSSSEDKYQEVIDRIVKKYENEAAMVDQKDLAEFYFESTFINTRKELFSFKKRKYLGSSTDGTTLTLPESTGETLVVKIMAEIHDLLDMERKIDANTTKRRERELSLEALVEVQELSLEALKVEMTRIEVEQAHIASTTRRRRKSKNPL